MSARSTRGLASSRPMVDSRVEKSRFSTRTSFPERLRKRLDFPAFVYPANPTVTACFLRCLRLSEADLFCFLCFFLRAANSALTFVKTEPAAVFPAPPKPARSPVVCCFTTSRRTVLSDCKRAILTCVLASTLEAWAVKRESKRRTRSQTSSPTVSFTPTNWRGVALV